MVATNTRPAGQPAPPPQRRTCFLPAPARLPAEPLHVVADRDALLDLAQTATVSSYDVAGDRDSIERLGQAVVDLIAQLAKVERERDEARRDFAKSRALHADTQLELQAAQVASLTLAERQRAPTIVMVQQTTIIVAAPRSKSMYFDVSDTEVIDPDDLPTPGPGQTRRMPSIVDVASSAGGAW